MRDALSFAWNECLSCESKNMKHFLLWARIIVRTSSIKNFTSSKIVRHDYFASFNQSNHCFLGLTSIFLLNSLFSRLGRSFVRSDWKKRRLCRQLACWHVNAMGIEDNSNNISVHFNKHNIDASTLIALTIHDCIKLFFKKFYPHLTINDHFKTVESSLIRDLNNLQFA